MAEKLEVSGDDDSSLDSILSRLNSLGESAADIKESAPNLRGVPDLVGDEHPDSSDESGDVPGPPSLSLVEESPVEENTASEETVSSSSSEETVSAKPESTESPFRSNGLFGSPADTEVSEPASSTEAVAAPVVNADALAAFMGTEDKQDESAEKVAEISSPEDGDSVESKARVEQVEEKTPDKIDYFADLHSGDAPQIAGVAAEKRADFVPESKPKQPQLDKGLTAAQAFVHHPEQKDVILTDTKGLLADPLDIKPATPKNLDAASYEEHFSHGVQFPGVGAEQNYGSGLDSEDPLYVENPYEDVQLKEKSISVTSFVFVGLLVIAVIVLFIILGDPSIIEDLRGGVTSISE